MATKELLDTLLKTPGIESESIQLMDLYVFNYKIGPVLKSLTYKAKNLANAQEEADRLVSWMNSRTIRKVVLVGSPKPLAVTVDQEIARLERQIEIHGDI